jgi:hypothetical protein
LQLTARCSPSIEVQAARLYFQRQRGLGAAADGATAARTLRGDAAIYHYLRRDAPAESHIGMYLPPTPLSEALLDAGVGRPRHGIHGWRTPIRWRASVGSTLTTSRWADLFVTGPVACCAPQMS